jgi:hypothetical protein
MYRFGKRLKNPDVIALAVAAFHDAENQSPSGDKMHPALGAAGWPVTLPAIFTEAEFVKLSPRQARLTRDTWLPDSCVMAARREADSIKGLYLACVAADNGKSHSHNDTGNFWVYSDGRPVLIDLGQETYRKKSFDAHRYEIPSTQSGFHNLPTIGTVEQGVGPQFRATDLAYNADDRGAQLRMELRKAYPDTARLKTWTRTVRLDRTANIITVEDLYVLSGAASPVTLNLMTALAVIEGHGKLTLNNPDGSPCALITFDPALLVPVVETIHLDNEELVQNWGAQVFRICLKTGRAESSSRLKLTISAA